MTVPIVCPACGTAYANVKLPPGSAFACGNCGHAMHVPGAQPAETDAQAKDADALPVVQPTRPAPGKAPTPTVQPTASPAPPVVTPTPSGPKSPVVTPSKPAAVQPRRANPTKSGDDTSGQATVSPTPRPKVAPARGRGAPPKSGRRPTTGRIKRPGPMPSSPKPEGPADAPPKETAAQARPEGRPRPGSRRTGSRAVTRVISEHEIGMPPRKKSKTPLALAAVFGVACVAVLVIVIVSASGGDAEAHERESYIAGYEAGARNRVRMAFGLGREPGDAAWKRFKADYEGAQRQQFREGSKAGSKAADPAYGGDDVKALVFDLETIRTAIVQMTTRDGDADAASIWRSTVRVKQALDRWAEEAPAAVTAELKTTHETLMSKVIASDQDHAEARAARGEIKYGDALKTYAEAAWLKEGDRDDAKRTHARLKKLADENGGWIAAELKAEIDRVRARVAQQEKERGGQGGDDD